MTKKYLDNLTRSIIGAAIEVHKAIGPGQLEKIYHLCMMEELRLRGINFVSEKDVPINYKGKQMGTDMRCDLFVENCISTELKSAQAITAINEAQLLSYMTHLHSPKGVIINFNCLNIFKEGQKTFVNKLYEELPDE
jgi:GxxExxY protein